MSYYTREEQETVYRYDPIDKRWYIYSTYPPHIRRIMERGQVTAKHEDEKGRVILTEAVVEPNQVRLFKPR